MFPDLAPEDRLCLLLAQLRRPPEAEGQLHTLLRGRIRWDLLLERSVAHSVYPLVYQNLRALGNNAVVPDDVLEALEKLYQVNAFRNRLQGEELSRVLDKLHASGIPVIPLKGLPLAEALYGEMGLRVSSDLDILVPRDAIFPAYQALSVAGYRADFPAWMLTEQTTRNSFEFPMSREGRAMTYSLELHCGLIWEAAVDGGSSQDLWKEARPMKFCGVAAYRLSPEWEFLFLTAHAARHLWRGLKWLVDIHEICRKAEVDWQAAALKAERFGWERFVRETLTICQNLLATPVPSQFPAADIPNYRGFPRDPALPTPIEGTLWALRYTPRTADRIRLLARRLVVPTPFDYQWWRLPQSLGFLYYFLRPLRLGYHTARALAKNAVRGLQKFL